MTTNCYTKSHILLGDSLTILKDMPSQSIHTCVTSPPYWGLRDYGVEGQLGLEKTPDEYVQNMVSLFSEVKRVLTDDGTLWINLGDSYASGSKNRTFDQASANSKLAGGKLTQQQSLVQQSKIVAGLKPKDLVGIPWRVAFALQKDGWYLRQDIIWHKPNPMPESVTDRCTKAHEYIFLLSKSPKYYFNNEAIKEPAKRPEGPGNRKKYDVPRQRQGTNANITEGLHKIGPKETRQKRSVWTVTTKPFKGAHFATFPPDLIEPCILAGCPEGGVVLDPFFGAGTTGLVAQKHNRKYIGIELNPEYIKIAEKRIEALP